MIIDKTDFDFSLIYCVLKSSYLSEQKPYIVNQKHLLYIFTKSNPALQRFSMKNEIIHRQKAVSQLESNR